MAVEGESRRRPLALALSAIAPVLLVALWLGFGGSEDARAPSPASRDSAGLAETQRPTAPVPPSEARARREPSGDGLASLAERQQAMERMERENEAQRRREGGPDMRGNEYPQETADWEAYRDGQEWAEDTTDDRRRGPQEPSPEEVDEMMRLTAGSTPPPEVLEALMEEAQPMPSPSEIAELRERTEVLLDFDKDLIEQVRRESNARRPTPERLAELERRRDAEAAERAAAGAN
jgi:hypothetical protein